jgi:hypothetical protein
MKPMLRIPRVEKIVPAPRVSSSFPLRLPSAGSCNQSSGSAVGSPRVGGAMGHLVGSYYNSTESSADARNHKPRRWTYLVCKFGIFESSRTVKERPTGRIRATWRTHGRCIRRRRAIHVGHTWQQALTDEQRQLGIHQTATTVNTSGNPMASDVAPLWTGDGARVADVGELSSEGVRDSSMAGTR